MTPSLGRTFNQAGAVAYLAGVLGASMLLVLLGASSGFASPPGSNACEKSQPPPPHIGSLAEYMGRDPGEWEPSYVSRVGIQIIEDRARLASGQMMAGLSVISVEPLSLAEDAGIRSERVPTATAAEQLGLSVAVIGSMLFFPPAALGVAMIPKLHWNKARDVIVAVDAERTRNICDLEASLRNAKAGEIIYLTVVRNGQREQLQIVVPSGFEDAF